MVFAINPVQTSAKNFTAFQNVAEANGTALAAENQPYYGHNDSQRSVYC